MNIIIDARRLLPIHMKTGMFYYTENLIKHIVRIDIENQYFLFYGAGLRQHSTYPSISDAPNLHNKLIRMPTRLYRFIERKWPLFPIGPWLGKYDVFHSPTFLAPLYVRRCVLTIMDMIAFKFPHFYPPDLEFTNLLRQCLPTLSKQAARIITISESSKRDIVDILQIPAERVVVTPLAASTQYQLMNDQKIIERIKAKYGIMGSYICHLGTLEPRKNIVALVKAYAKLKAKSLPHFLLLVGNKGWFCEEIFIAISQLGLEKDVIIPGYVGDEDVPALLNGADLFVYPSFYEGFGLPILEAMSCGVPVITSNVSSLPEVVGDAAILIDPNDVDQLAAAMEKVLSDASLKEELRRKGLERAKQFSWDKTAYKTLRVYEEVAAS